MTKEAPYKGPGADSEEKREPVSDIDVAVADSLRVHDLKRPIREADMPIQGLIDVRKKLAEMVEHIDILMGEDTRTR